jgi:hypothetical protein
VCWVSGRLFLDLRLGIAHRGAIGGHVGIGVARRAARIRVGHVFVVLLFDVAGCHVVRRWNAKVRLRYWYCDGAGLECSDGSSIRGLGKRWAVDVWVVLKGGLGGGSTKTRKIRALWAVLLRRRVRGVGGERAV